MYLSWSCPISKKEAARKINAAIAELHTCTRRKLASQFQQMIYKGYGQHFGNKGSETIVSIVGLGCSSFSNFFLDEKSKFSSFERSSPLVRGWIETIIYALTQSKINLLDTAPWYGNGSSEVVIGWAMDEVLRAPFVAGGIGQQQPIMHYESGEDHVKIDRASIFVNTKVGRYEPDPSLQFDFSREATLQSVERSLARMKSGYIDVLQLHDPEFSPSLELLLEETIPAMLECKAKGWCRAIGLTGYPLQVQHQILQASLEKFGRSVWDQAMTYCHFNLHDSSLVSQPLTVTGKSFADYCKEHEVEIVVAAPLSMGLLTQQGPPKWHPASQELKDACRMARDLLTQEFDNASISKIALYVALALAIEHDIPCTVLGMKDIDEVKYVDEIVNHLKGCLRVDDNPGPTTSQPGSTSARQMLSAALQPNEFAAWERLQDPLSSPFAEAWKNGTSQWNGIEEVRRFWRKVPGATVAAWQREAI